MEVESAQEDRRRHVVPAHKGLLMTFCTGATSRKRNAAKQNRVCALEMSVRNL